MSKAPHILVIDDNEDILYMIQAMPESNGYNVTVRDSPGNIGEMLAAIKPDVLLMDMLLSGSDGREVCRHIKSQSATRNIPVIMISAHPQAAEDCIAAGADYFLEKPFDMEVMFASLEKAIDSGEKIDDGKNIDPDRKKGF